MKTPKEWWNTSDLLAKLAAGGGTLAAIAVAAYFITQWQIPDEGAAIRTSTGQYIFSRELTINEPVSFGVKITHQTPSGPLEFYAETQDTFLSLCNMVPIGTTEVAVAAVDSFNQRSEWTRLLVIKTEDSLWSQPWPEAPTEPEEPGYYFAFDEAAGDTTRTDSRDAFGILVGGAGWATGQSGACISFTGADARVGITPSIDSPSPDSLRISAWIYVDNFDVADARIVSKATGTAGADHWWMVSTYGDRALRFRLKTAGETTTLISTAQVLEAGRWQEIIARYDGNMMRIIVDNIVEGATAKTGAIDRDPAVPVAIGDQPQGGKTFHGRIDELMIQ